MKHLFSLAAGLILAWNLQGPAQAGSTAFSGDFLQLEQKVRLLLPQADSVQEFESLNQWLLEMYLWSKDNFEVGQWPEIALALERWPAMLQQHRAQFKGRDETALRSLEAAYWLLLHDFGKARQLALQLPGQDAGPYPAMIQALLGEQDPDNPGIWRISLEQARLLVRRYPQQELAYLLLAEAVLERVQEPGAEPELLKEAQWAVTRLLRLAPQQSFGRYQQGQLLYLQQHGDEARRYFERQVLPQGPVAAEAVGNFYSWMQDPETALAFFEKARQQAPDSLRIYQKMEQLYLQTRPSEAVRLYLKGLARLPEVSAFYQRLQGLYDQIQPEVLRSWLQQDLPAGSYSSRLILGDLALREGDARTAEHWYTKALEQNPKRREAYLNLLTQYWEGKDLASMSQLLAKSRSQGIQDAELDYWHGVLALQQGRLAEARALLEPLAKEDLKARYTLAMVYRQQGELVKARQLLSSLIEQEPQNLVLILALGDLYLEARSFAEAEEVYQLARRIEPYNAAVFFSLSNLYAETQRYDEAIEALERAILIAPDEPDFRNNLGSIYLRQQRTEDAIREFEAIVEKRPDYAEAYYNLACVYALSRRHDQALRYLQRAIALDARLRQTAREDHDLDTLRLDRRFQELLR
ncbi:MAG: tetratricopeptide repeat protein [Candidatus Sericytochromatia bacterium]